MTNGESRHLRSASKPGSRQSFEDCNMEKPTLMLQGRHRQNSLLGGDVIYEYEACNDDDSDSNTAKRAASLSHPAYRAFDDLTIGTQKPDAAARKVNDSNRIDALLGINAGPAESMTTQHTSQHVSPSAVEDGWWADAPTDRASQGSTLPATNLADTAHVTNVQVFAQPRDAPAPRCQHIVGCRCATSAPAPNTGAAPIATQTAGSRMPWSWPSSAEFRRLLDIDHGGCIWTFLAFIGCGFVMAFWAISTLWSLTGDEWAVRSKQYLSRTIAIALIFQILTLSGAVNWYTMCWWIVIITCLWDLLM